MFFPGWGYDGGLPRTYEDDYGWTPRSAGPWGGRAQPRARQAQNRSPPLFYWDQGRGGLVPVSLGRGEDEGVEDPRPDASYWSDPFFTSRRPVRSERAPPPRTIPVRSPYFTAPPEPPAEAYDYPFAAPRASRAPQFPPRAAARNPRVSIPSSSSSISAAPPLKGYSHDNQGARPYSEWGSKGSDDEEDVEAGSEPEAGPVDDDDTLVDPSELEQALSLQKLLNQQKQAQQAQAEAQAREYALQQQRQKLLRQQQRAAAQQAQQAQQQAQQAQQAALDQASSRKSSGPIRIPVQLVNPGTATKPATKVQPKAQSRAQPLQQEPGVYKEPSNELALSPQPSELLQALSALLGGQEQREQQHKEQEEKERKLREQQAQREQQQKEQQQREQQQREQQQREQQEQAERKKKVSMSRSTAARIFQKVWRGRYLARQRPALRNMCRISAKLRENKQKLTQYTAGGSGLNHKQFLELNEGAMQAVLGLDNLPWQGEGQIPQELRCIKKQLTAQAMTLQDQVETLTSPAEKEKAFTRPDLRDPPEDNSRVRVMLVVENGHEQQQQQQAAGRPTVADGATQTDQEPACIPAASAADGFSHHKDALSTDHQDQMPADEATEEEDDGEAEPEGADFTFDMGLEADKKMGMQGNAGRGKPGNKRGKGRNNKAHNKGGATIPHANGRQTVGAA